MLDSTIIERIGKYLTPDEKIKNSNKVLNEFLESASFKASFRKRCERNLSKLSKKRSYYRKFKKSQTPVPKESLEEVLQKKQQSLAEHALSNDNSALLKERISKLEFLFKKVVLFKKPADGPLPSVLTDHETDNEENARAQ
ncbi:hypothetical protein NECID01_1166 [Nematocida sp. AWRm77]|nr:hypothetical protein NECID01_1166 [Nematocida sp. AWRm77]